MIVKVVSEWVIKESSTRTEIMVQDMVKEKISVII